MKKSPLYFPFTFLLFFCFTANAQNFYLGVRGGISIPNLTAGGSNQNPLNTGYSSRLGPDAGAFAEFKFSNLFSLQPMIEYSSQGGKKNGMQAFPTPAQFAAFFDPRPAPTYLYANYNYPKVYLRRRFLGPFLVLLGLVCLILNLKIIGIPFSI
ncbi:MAG: outer membrane beta-barrel protein, partial [Mucilaginibacter sp.]